jgi:exonuclease III
MDPTKLLIWNVRGLNSSVRQDSIKELVGSSQVDVVCLQETKMQIITRRTILSMLGADFSDYVYLPSVGASGGILIAWRRHIGHTGQQKLKDHSISVQFCKAEGQAWWLTCVYDPQGEGGKIQFLRNLEILEMNAMVLGWWLEISTSSIALLIRIIPILIGQ